ncbi:MAG: amidohydrolase family protein, partial [Gammaproteobacteria bacterium]|nr:amidohydrolase family protein [Gammaproteobacteria bacterium]
PITDLNRSDMIDTNRHLAMGAAFDWSWDSMGGYLDRLDASGIAVNVLALVGHVPIRTAVMGYAKRYPTTDELNEMKSLLRTSLEEGAFGFSTGLIFPPSSYSDTDEIVELAGVLAEFGGVYFSHIRGEGHSLLRAVAEAIEIGERAGVAVQIAHHKASGRPFWGRIRDSLSMIEAAQERGVDVTVDVYPYTAGSGGLTQLIPEWAHEGGPEGILARLRDTVVREQLQAELRSGWREWDTIFVSWTASGNPDVVGKSIAEIASQRDLPAETAAYDILIEEELQGVMVHFGMDEDDVRYVLRHPAAMIGSDGSAISPEPPLSMGRPHPRYYGAFPRVLGHYARDENLFSLEEAVHKMTGFPARKMGLDAKGILEPGRDADLVVFDPDRVIDTATFEDPHQFPEGIVHVIVGGELVVNDGKQTTELSGRALRGPQAK